MGVGQLSESDAVDALRLPFYSSSHPTGSHGWRNQFDLGNPEWSVPTGPVPTAGPPFGRPWTAVKFWPAGLTIAGRVWAIFFTPLGWVQTKPLNNFDA